MEFIALLQDSTDEDSDNGTSNGKSKSNSNSNGSSDQEISGNEKKLPPKIKAKEVKNLSSPSNTIHTDTAPSATDSGRRRKVRRRGSVDVVSSKEAQVSGVFSRSIPHRRGHWAGHIKIPILTTTSLYDDDDDDLETLRKLKASSVEASRNLLERQGISGTMVEHDDLHLSLSKHFSLQVAHIEPFVQRLGELLRREPGTSLHVDTAWGLHEYQESSRLTTTQGGDHAGGGGIDEIVLLNEEKTRSFFCWSVRPTATLGRIVSHIDAVLKRYNQPVYYEPARFHISFASFPGNIIETLNKSEVVCSHSSGSDDDCSADHDLRHNQSSTNCSLDFSSVAASTSKNETKRNEDDVDDSSSSSSSSSVEKRFVLPVHELRCTLGTTKEFAMPLRTCQQL